MGAAGLLLHMTTRAFGSVAGFELEVRYLVVPSWNGVVA